MKNKIAAYKEILEVAKSHSDVIEGDDINLSVRSLENFLTKLEVSDSFGIPLRDAKNSYEGWLNVKGDWNAWMILGHFGEEQRRTISWSDDGSQPEDEWLFRIGFSIGAYIFGDVMEDSYPKEAFQAFFEELKSYSPKYTDSVNRCLYFTEENAKVVYEAFWDIYNKYEAQVGEELKAKRKKELEEELAKLS